MEEVVELEVRIAVVRFAELRSSPEERFCFLGQQQCNYVKLRRSPLSDEVTRDQRTQWVVFEPNDGSQPSR
jgi:hypothetical protein